MYSVLVQNIFHLRLCSSQSDTLETFLEGFPRDASVDVGEFFPCHFCGVMTTTSYDLGKGGAFLCYV